MESWLKSAAKLGSQLQDFVDIVTPDGKEVEFEEGPFGFQLEFSSDGICVSSVDVGGQAEQKGLSAGDHLLAIAGYEIRMPKKWDEESKRSLQKKISKDLKLLPRPGTLTFRKASGGEHVDDATVGLQKMVQQRGDQKQLQPGDKDTSIKSTPDQTRGHHGSAESSPPGPPKHKEEVVVVAVVDDDELTVLKSSFKEAMAKLEQSQEEVGMLRTELFVSQEFGRQLQQELDVLKQNKKLTSARRRRRDDLVGDGGEEGNDEDEDEDDDEDKLTFSSASVKKELQLKDLRHRLEVASETIAEQKRSLAELQHRVLGETRAREHLEQQLAMSEEVESEAYKDREQILEGEVQRLHRELQDLSNSHRNLLKSTEEKLMERLKQAEKDHLATRTFHERNEAKLQREVLESMRRATLAEGTLQAERTRHEDEMGSLRRELTQVTSSFERRLSELQEEVQMAKTSSGLRSSGNVTPMTTVAPTEGRAAPRSKNDEEDEDEEEDEDDDLKGDEELEEEGVTETNKNSGIDSLSVDQEHSEPKDSSIQLSNEVELLRSALAAAEQRSEALEKKLRSRPIVFERPRGKSSKTPADHPDLSRTWEPWIRERLPPGLAATALQWIDVPDQAMRTVTSKLLSKMAWMRLFYLHIILLYAATAFWYAQTTAAPQDTPLEALQQGSLSLRGSGT